MSMKRETTVLLLAGLLTAPVTAHAQARGSSHSAPAAAAHALAPRPPAMPARGGPTIHAGPAGPVIPLHVPTVPVRVTARPVVVPVAAPSYSPFYAAGYFGYGAPYGSAYTASSAYTSAPAATTDYSYAGSDINDLNNQIQQLSAEVEQLRSDQMQRDADEVAPRSTADEVPTILVYRDGHRMNIYNYAVTGDTLWVLTGRSSIRVLLSDLDLAATQTVNQDNGVRFLLRQQ